MLYKLDTEVDSRDRVVGKVSVQHADDHRPVIRCADLDQRHEGHDSTLPLPYETVQLKSQLLIAG